MNQKSNIRISVGLHLIKGRCGTSFLKLRLRRMQPSLFQLHSRSQHSSAVFTQTGGWKPFNRVAVHLRNFQLGMMIEMDWTLALSAAHGDKRKEQKSMRATLMAGLPCFS